MTSQSLSPFSIDGLLPVGDYSLTIADLSRSHLVQSPRNRDSTWDSRWRAGLVANLSILAGELARVGITEVFVDGSFVEDNDHPNDIDGYFACDLQRLASGELERDLNSKSARKCWSWDHRKRRRVAGHGWKLPMWIDYRVELYPHFGQPTGIVDRFGNELQFPAAFRLSRTGLPKGIVRLVR